MHLISLVLMHLNLCNEKKNIFNKKSKVKYYLKLLLISLFLLIFILIIYILKYIRYNFFIIDKFKDNFYIIPEDKGGTKNS